MGVVVRGMVQGVGFRPFVHGLASNLSLTGFVKNRSGDVLIEVEGGRRELDRFIDQLQRGHCSARIEDLRCTPLDRRGGRGFLIEASEQDACSALSFAPDVATCDACLLELFDPTDRRHLHPFINCSTCGPRFTIVRAAPYDRERTTMAAFPMCSECRAEYEDPNSRRFHAQAISCASCGPTLALVNADGPLPGDPVEAAVGLLRGGMIVAIKGIGGYHLACDASNEEAVARLRRRKNREEKPFAVMHAEPALVCEVDTAEDALLRASSRPIVLLRRREESGIAASVAPSNPRLGVMLPYTPLHHLILAELDGPFVLTSGNRSNEPIAHQDEDAIARLSGIADAFLIHDRVIETRCDDSVMEVAEGAPVVLRRSRGEVPGSIELPFATNRRVLALGGHLKNTFALSSGDRAFASPHLGDLGDHRSERAFRDAIAHYERLLSFTPELIAHDLHPEYATTHYARERGIPRLAVQHHHAHLASCLLDNGLFGPAIAVAFDGTGYGTDGTLWGGEFLIGDYRTFFRAAHLRAVPMPGGEQAIREVWRMALSQLVDAGEDPAELSTRIPQPGLRVVKQMIERSVGSPPTSSAGRLFDAVAGIVGLRDRAGFEAQAALQLEWCARTSSDDASYPFELQEKDRTTVVDTRPLIRAIMRDRREGRAPPVIARRFHTTMAAMIEAVVGRLRDTTGIETVVLTGGVFANGILLRETKDRLARAGLRAYSHRRIPANDGGLSLGQLAIGIAHLEGGG